MNQPIDLKHHVLKGFFVGPMARSKMDRFMQELNTVLIKYCKEDYFLETDVTIIESKTYKEKTEEITVNENQGLITCPYTLEWCDKLKDTDYKSFVIPLQK